MDDRRERFERVAGKRVQYILDKLDSLGKCANRSNYKYNKKDVNKMFRAIKQKLSQVETRYKDELNKNSKSKFQF